MLADSRCAFDGAVGYRLAAYCPAVWKQLSVPSGRAAEGKTEHYRSASGIHFLPVGPVYSDSGRMSRLWACCSMTCAHQPAIRPTAKIDVPRSAGIPRNVYVVAA